MYKCVLLDENKVKLEEKETEDPIDGSFFDGEETFYRMVGDPRIIPDPEPPPLPSYKETNSPSNVIELESDEGAALQEIMVSNVMVGINFFIGCFINYGRFDCHPMITLSEAKRIKDTGISEVDSCMSYPRIQINRDLKTIKLWWFFDHPKRRHDVTIYDALI